MKFYCFLWQRQIDSQPWPLIFTDRELADHHRERVSEVVEVELEATLPGKQNQRPWNPVQSTEVQS